MQENSDWVKEAFCVGTKVDFFSTKKTKEMAKICSNCPVLEQCYEYAVHNERFGFWGGHTSEEIQKERRSRGLPEPTNDFIFVKPKKQETEIKHGTRRGYGQHRYFKIPVCDLCRQANSEFQRQLRTKASA
jgi:hypothetical protein